MPEYLELVFTFGYQEHPKELNYSGFWQRTSLHPSKSLQVPELGLSGSGWQLCYGLKSVESSPVQRHWQWSIRHCAIFHSFDVSHIRANWVIIKGDRETERRVQSGTSGGGASEPSRYDTIAGAFASAMEMHLMLCDSATENWRWYISFLEDKLQTMTRSIKSVTASIPPLPPGVTKESLDSRKSGSTDDQSRGQQQFSFSDLQDTQHVEEKTKDTLLALKLDLQVIMQLGMFYQYTIDNQDLPQTLRTACWRDVNSFLRRIEDIKNNIQMQVLRVEALLHLLAERKTLLRGLLDFQNLQANKFLAAESYKATKNMEYMTSDTRQMTLDMRYMTEDMHEIARKTKTETVSMKIITLVTLFFLPGTFISR
ncbi:MAG: hypothetical protein Q9219_003714 [cf. Caloplaca sp. 3 TL-2023]